MTTSNHKPAKTLRQHEVDRNPQQPRDLKELSDLWGRGGITRSFYYQSLLELVDESNVDEEMIGLPADIRMYFLRHILSWLEHGIPFADENLKQGAELLVAWAQTNFELARSIAFPEYEDPGDIEGLLRLQRQHVLTHSDFERIMLKILSAGDIRDHLNKFPDAESAMLRRWIRNNIRHGRGRRLGLTDAHLKQIQDWYSERTQIDP